MPRSRTGNTGYNLDKTVELDFRPDVFRNSRGIPPPVAGPAMEKRKMHPGKIAVAATAFACTTLLTFTWSEQYGASLSVNRAQAIENAESGENAKATVNTKARVMHRQTRASAEHVARRHYSRSAYGPGPVRGPGPNPVAAGAAVAAGAVDTAAGIAGAATSPWVYPGGGPYASAEGWQGGGYATSPWGDYDCRPTSKFECRPYASKTWK